MVGCLKPVFILMWIMFNVP